MKKYRVYYIGFIIFIIMLSCALPATNSDDNNYDSYTIGSTGQGGGIIFYDKGIYTDDWRYIEVTKMDVSTSVPWGGYMKDVYGLSVELGAGATNTSIIVNSNSSTYTAAYLCYDLVSGGYSDWCLPSQDELLYIYNNLKKTSLVYIAGDRYWTSNQSSEAHAYDIEFDSGEVHGYRKDLYARARAIRYF